MSGKRQRGDWRDWLWDPTLFEGAAPYYERGRLPYAERLADGFRDALGLTSEPSGRLLDVGCGPGSIALRLAHLFDEVVGLDPDREMLAEAARLAFERHVRNVRWEHRRAEDIDDSLGRFRAVTFAQSFHWMDRPLVARKVRAILEPGGAVVHVDVSGRSQGAAELVGDVVRRYLGDDRRAGQSIRNTSPDDEDAVFRAAGFDGPHITVVPDGRTVKRSIDDLVAEVLSSSFAAPHLFGDRLDEFVRDVRRALDRAFPRGHLDVTLSDNRLKVWRPV